MRSGRSPRRRARSRSRGSVSRVERAFAAAPQRAPARPGDARPAVPVPDVAAREPVRAVRPSIRASGGRLARGRSGRGRGVRAARPGPARRAGRPRWASRHEHRLRDRRAECPVRVRPRRRPGTAHAAIARTSRSSLKGRKSSKLPPPRATMITSSQALRRAAAKHRRPLLQPAGPGRRSRRRRRAPAGSASESRPERPASRPRRCP